MIRKTGPRPARGGVALAALSLVLTACGGSSSTSNTDGGSGESVPAGSDQQEYIDALADAEETTLVLQLPAAEDSILSASGLAWAKSVEEWSGGKVNFDIVYSNAIANAEQVTSAVAEGLVDITYVTAVRTNPEEFQVNSLQGDLMFLNQASPIAGALQLNSSWIDVGVHNEEVNQEFEDFGIQPLLPLLPSAQASLLCQDSEATSPESVDGLLLRATSPSVTRQAEALGFKTVEVPSAEAYDAMQRGAYDCEAGSPTSFAFGGLLEVGDNWTLDQDLRFPATATGWFIGKDVWDSMPLAAQQVLWDRLGVFIEAYVTNQIWGTLDLAVTTAKESGTEIREADEDLIAATDEYLEGVLAEIRDREIDGVDMGAQVDMAIEANDKWTAIVKELGVESGDYATFADDYPGNTPDLTEYVGRVMDELITPNRPS